MSGCGYNEEYGDHCDLGEGVEGVEGSVRLSVKSISAVSCSGVTSPSPILKDSVENDVIN